MIKVKHLMDSIEADDGQRLWVEPIGLTGDLREWCRVDHLLPEIGPPTGLWEWLMEHPDGYEYFRGRYHEHLDQSALNNPLFALARASREANITLLHQGEDPNHNTAAALHEYLSELQYYLKS